MRGRGEAHAFFIELSGRRQLSMLTTLSITNYRSIRVLTISMGKLNLITGANGTGKSNLYRGLRLLAETARGGVIRSLAAEGGLASTFWAGPERVSRAMREGDAPYQGGKRRSGALRLRLGFATEDFGYAIALGLPPPKPPSEFRLDPEIKREAVWAGPVFRRSSHLVDRNGALVKRRVEKRWEVVYQHMSTFESMFSYVTDPAATPEVLVLREMIRAWRFYDLFRTDRDAPARAPQLGTRTPALHHDGRDLAAAVQTILEIGDEVAFHRAIEDAFPGAKVDVARYEDGRFSLQFHQPGLLRPLLAAELSDGTLRYILWVAALLTPRPPPMIVLNEPETSLHRDLLPALARLIVRASETTQVWVVTHAPALIEALRRQPACCSIDLEKSHGQTEVVGRKGLLDAPSWYWPDAK